MELRKYWEIFRRRRKVFFGSFLLFVALVLIGMFTVTATYEARAKVLLVESSKSLGTLMSSLGMKGGGATTSTTTTSTTADTDINLATLRPILLKVIAKLNLKDRDGSVLKPEKLIKSSVLNKIAPRPYIYVEQLDESDILDVVSNSRSPAEAANMSNELARFYIEDRVDRVRKEYRSARVLVEKRIGEIKAQYEEALRLKKEFLTEEKIVDLDTESKALIQQRSDLEVKLDDFLNDFSGLTTELKALHPDVQKLNKKIESLKRIIKEKDETVATGVPAKIMKQSQLDLAITVYQDVYKSLLSVLTNMNVAESVTISSISLVEEAALPYEVYFPKKPLTLAIGIFLGMFWAIGFTFLVEYADDTIKCREDLGKYPVPVLGSTPNFSDRSILSSVDPNHPFFEAYRKVLSSIRFRRMEAPPKTLLISSIGPGEGCSTTSANLGIAYASEGKRVLVVDADLRAPKLHRIFNVFNDEGLSDVLGGKVAVETVECVIRETGISGVHFLPSGPEVSDPGLLLNSNTMRDVIRGLKERYDIVIFHSAPLIMRNDGISLMSELDGMILVVRNAVTPLPALSLVYEKLEQAKIEPIGFVLNCSFNDEYGMLKWHVLLRGEKGGK